MGVSRWFHHQSYHNHHRLIPDLCDFDLLEVRRRLEIDWPASPMLDGKLHTRQNGSLSLVVWDGKMFGESRVDMP